MCKSVSQNRLIEITETSDNEAKSEYQEELERLRAEVASLKSDLATCQSQSAFADDFDPVL